MGASISTSERTALSRGIEEGDIAVISLLIHRSPALLHAALDDSGNTLAHLSVLKWDLDMLRLILSYSRIPW